MSMPVSRESKLMVTKDIVANYVRGEGGKELTPDQLCDLVGKVYKKVDELAPEPEGRKVGLGV